MDKWRALLISRIEATSMRQVADEVGVSHALISQLMRGRYAGDVPRYAAIILGLYGNEAGMDCPVLGYIEPSRCAGHHATAKRVGLGVGNRHLITLYGTCKRCPKRGGS